MIFDLDGTLVDTAPDIAAALEATVAGVGVAAPPLDVVKTMVGDGARELIRRALAAAGADGDLDALHAAFLAHYRAHVSDRSAAYPGVTEALDALHAAGVACAVITNKPGDIARRLLRGSVARESVRRDHRRRRRLPAQAGSRRGAVAARRCRHAAGRVRRSSATACPTFAWRARLGARAISAAWGYVAADRLAAEKPDALARTPEEAARLVLSP